MVSAVLLTVSERDDDIPLPHSPLELAVYSLLYMYNYHRYRGVFVSCVSYHLTSSSQVLLDPL